MKKLIKILTSAVIATALTLTCVISAFAADTSDYVSKEKIIEELWGQYWDTNDTDPTTFPESSWDYYILNDWLERNYGHEELIDKVINSSRCNWTKLSDISRKYRDYREQLTENWHFNDESGQWTIEEYDPETGRTGDRLYHFNFNQGQWSMIDENGDTIYSFAPMTSYVDNGKENDLDTDDDIKDFLKGMSGEDDNESSNSSEDKVSNAETPSGSTAQAGEPAQGGARVTGKTENTPAVASSDSSSESQATSSVDDNTQNGTSTIVMVLCIIVIAGIVVIIILYLKRKKDENKK